MVASLRTTDDDVVTTAAVAAAFIMRWLWDTNKMITIHEHEQDHDRSNEQMSITVVLFGAVYKNLKRQVNNEAILYI
jgi:hypothetical protein